MIKKIAFATTAYMMMVGFSVAGCLQYAGDGWFQNNCGYKLIFDFRTDGGCYEGPNGHGAETVAAYGSVKTGVDMSCGSGAPTYVYWSECEYDQWLTDDCIPRA